MLTPKKKTDDDLAREKIPSLADLDTLYRPMGNMLMVIPLDDIIQVGTLVLPDAHKIVLNEGHIVAMGPRCMEKMFEVGDCVLWEKHTETRFTSEGRAFVIVNEPNVLMRIPALVLLEQAKGFRVEPKPTRPPDRPAA